MRFFGLEIRRARPFDSAAYANFPKSSVANKRFLNIGAGRFTHPYWTNLDHATKHYGELLAPFVEHDLMSLKPLPFEDNSIEAADMSHVAEHISDEAAAVCFAETHRILKPGGVFRLTGPDILLSYQAMVRGDVGFWYDINGLRRENLLSAARITPQQLLMFELATELSTLSKKPVYKVKDEEIDEAFRDGPVPDAFNRFTSRCSYSEDYAGHHISWWTVDKAVRMLLRAGFPVVNASAYGQSQSPPLRDLNFFDGTHPKMSFYVEAIK